MRLHSIHFCLFAGWLGIFKISGTACQTLYIDEKFCKLEDTKISCRNIDARNYKTVKFTFAASSAKSIYINDSYLPLAPEGIFETNPNIERLNINVVRLEHFPPNMLKNANKLKDLSLDLNEYRLLPDGLFKGSPNLEVIYLTRSKLESVRRNTFTGITARLSIYSDNNRIREIHPDAFEGINLQRWDLADNNLTAADLGFLKNTDVPDLFLAGNCLGDIPTTMFALKKKLRFLRLERACLPNITKLYGGLPSTLTLLNLNEVDLTDLDMGLFVSTPNLEQLYMKKTNVKPKTVIEILELLRLKYIDFTENNYNCTDMARVVIAAKKAKVNYVGQGKVNNKPNIDGIPCLV